MLSFNDTYPLVKRIIYFVFLIPFLILSDTFAQHIPTNERSDPSFRAKNQLEANNIRTTIFNWGQTGRETGSVPFSEQTPYEWFKNTGQVYLSATGH